MRLLDNKVSEELIMSMHYLYLKTFAEDKTTVGVTEELFNEYNIGLLKLEVKSNSSFSFRVEGRIDEEASWTTLKVFNSAYEMADAVTASGIYTVDISCMPHVRAYVTSAASTGLTIVGSLGE